MTKERMQMSVQTVKENIAILESQEPQDAGYYLQLEHEKFVLSSLEKQIPKKPILNNVTSMLIKMGDTEWHRDITQYKCPNCNKNTSKIYNYCDKCGQALDWGEEE